LIAEVGTLTDINDAMHVLVHENVSKVMAKPIRKGCCS
jgi:hypothetical protein